MTSGLETRRLVLTGWRAVVLGLGLPLTLYAQGGPPPATVVVAETTRTTLAPMVSIPGTVVSRHDSRLASEVTGRLIWIADVGTIVSRGDPVARLKNTTLELQEVEYRGLVTRERARLTFLEPELERLKALEAENNAAKSLLDQTQSDLEVARGDLEVARARLRQIQDQLEKTTIDAPFDGIVVERLANLGEMINELDEVARLVSPQSIEVISRAPLNAVAFLSIGGEVRLDNDYRSGIGTVRTIVPFGDPQSHMFELRLDVPAEAWIVGESVRLNVPTAEPREVLAVPRDALVLRREGAFVYRVNREQIAERVAVTTGASDGDLIEVIGELSAGDVVVTRGGERLRPGQPVSVSNGGGDGGSSVAGTQ